MAIDKAKFDRMVADAARAKTEEDKAQGVYNTLFEQLKRDFEVSDLDEAREKLVKLRAEADRSEEAYNKELKEFEETHASVLEQLSQQR